MSRLPRRYWAQNLKARSSQVVCRVRASRHLAIIRQRFCPSKILRVKDVFLPARPGDLSLISACNDDFAHARSLRHLGIDVPPELPAIGDQMIELAIVGPSRA